MATKTPKALGPVSNGAAIQLEDGAPYIAAITVEGTSSLLFHNYNVESVAEKGAAKKGSAAKKTDDVESYLYRNPDGFLGIPGANFAASIAEAGRYKQDPRSPRKSARDLLKASVIPLDEVALFVHEKKPLTAADYLDQRRVVIMRSAVTRERPAMRKGWRVLFRMLVNSSEYVDPSMLRATIHQAGQLVGLCDFRPTYGRFDIVSFVIEKTD